MSSHTCAGTCSRLAFGIVDLHLVFAGFSSSGLAEIPQQPDVCFAINQGIGQQAIGPLERKRDPSSVEAAQFFLVSSCVNLDVLALGAARLHAANFGQLHRAVQRYYTRVIVRIRKFAVGRILILRTVGIFLFWIFRLGRTLSRARGLGLCIRSRGRFCNCHHCGGLRGSVVSGHT